MTQQEKELIQKLFKKLEDVSRNGSKPDPEAMQFIRKQIALMPDAPYYMAQTIVTQKFALDKAEQQLRSGGMLQQYQQQNQNFGQTMDNPSVRNSYGSGVGGGFGGGGFLAGAAQTALGLAGGILIANAAMSMFSAGADAVGGLFDDSSATDTGGADAATADANAEDYGSAEQAVSDTAGNEALGGDPGGSYLQEETSSFIDTPAYASQDPVSGFDADPGLGEIGSDFGGDFGGGDFGGGEF
jgi:hypothetical protein